MIFINKIHAIFNTFSNKNAFCIKNKYYSYSKFYSLIFSISKKIEIECKNQQRIGIIASDDIETYAAILACLLTGKTYIPLHPHQPSDRIQQIINQAGIEYLLSKSTDYSFDGIELINIENNGEEVNNSVLKIPDESIAYTYAYILFTSGSTGVPKGVPITYRNLDSFVEAFFALGYKHNEDDRFLQMFDLTFDLSIMSYLIPLCIGACVYTIPDTGTKFTNVYSTLEEHAITFALMVPSIITYLRPYFNEINLPHLKYSLFCGEALYKDVVCEWAKCVPNAIIENVYGPTEATIFCLTYPLNNIEELEEYNSMLSIGKPMQGMEAIVVDENKNQITNGTKGELCLFGLQLTPGYLNNERNKESFFELNNKKYYKTGDIAFINDKGNFLYCGRVDHQVKIQGFRVELSEIEFHLRKITNDINLVVLAIGNQNGFNQLFAVFETEMQNMEHIIDDLKQKVPAYMIPSEIHFVSSFPLNSNGKTDRNKLKELIQQSK